VKPAERVAWLREELARHNDAYFTNDAPLIPDADYDALAREIAGTGGRASELSDETSVSKKVGAPVSAVFSAVQHAEPMLSLDNVFDVDELRAWAERGAKTLGEDVATLSYAVEPKIDGLALSICTSMDFHARPRPVATAAWAKTSRQRENDPQRSALPRHRCSRAGRSAREVFLAKAILKN